MVGNPITTPATGSSTAVHCCDIDRDKAARAASRAITVSTLAWLASSITDHGQYRLVALVLGGHLLYKAWLAHNYCYTCLSEGCILCCCGQHLMCFMNAPPPHPLVPWQLNGRVATARGPVNAVTAHHPAASSAVLCSQPTSTPQMESFRASAVCFSLHQSSPSRMLLQLP